MRKRRALLSVADKEGIAGFARGLAGLGFEILSTGGTARVLEAAGVTVTPVEEVTGFPEMLDGRVKTLHPAVHGGILGRRDREEHRRALAEADIRPIDLVCVVFYPFEETAARAGASFEEVVEQIDIGGPALVRSAAKNHADVWVVTDPARYGEVLEALGGAGDGAELRRRLAREAFARTAAYDAAIAAWLGEREEEEGLPDRILLSLVKARDLRYGENPHLRGAFYRPALRAGEACVANAEVLSDRKALSLINLLDLDAGLELVREFEAPAAAVIKHTNPCGCAVGADLREAFARAHACDPLSAYGCVIALNREVDAGAAEEIASPNRFVQGIVAPGYAPEALEILRTRRKWGRNLRILATGPLGERRPGLSIREITGGYLVQDRNLLLLDPDLPGGFEVVTKRAPTPEERADLVFAWAVVKHVKSNAIVLAKDGAAIGVGAGQMSRVEAAELAVRRAGDRAAGSACASDAFFPFADGLEAPARAGATAFIQPGGSLRDGEVIEEADRRGVTMVFTRLRHFRH